MCFPDGLRALAVTMVMLPHAVGLFTYWRDPSQLTRSVISMMELGSLGVPVFFVLSGFVIAYSLRGRVVTLPLMLRFIVRRSVRLDPPYWFAIALFLAYLVLRRTIGTASIVLPGDAAVLAHLLYLQDIVGVGNMNAAFWTLAVEIQLYVAFCLLLWMGQKRRVLLCLAAFAGSLAWPVGLLASPLYRGSFFPYWHAFLAGVLVWWMVSAELPRVPGLLAILALWAVAATRVDAQLAATAASATVLLAAAPSSNLFRWLNFRPVQFLGKISYCIYLVHVPIAGLLLGALARLRPGREFVSYLFFAASLLFTAAAAYFLHLLIEVPALRWSKRISLTAGESNSTSRLII